MFSIKKRLIFSLFFLVLVISFNSCMSFKQSDKRVHREFKEVNLSPKIYRENFQGKTLRYITSKPIDNKLPTLLFIHGAPGASDNFFDYLKDDELSSKGDFRDFKKYK